MEKGRKNLFANLLPEGVNVVSNPNDNTLWTSRLQDDNGNVNLFRIIIDKDAPLLTQRIITNDN